MGDAWQTPENPWGIIDRGRATFLDMDINSGYPDIVECQCAGWSFNGPPELHPECPLHGDPAVLTQLGSKQSGKTHISKLMMSSTYGKDRVVSYPTYQPNLPAIVGADNRAAGVRSEEWSRKYIAETGVMCFVTWHEYPNQHVVKQYALYVDGSNKAALIGQKLEGIVQLRDFLDHVINSETGTVPVRDDQ